MSKPVWIKSLIFLNIISFFCWTERGIRQSRSVSIHVLGWDVAERRPWIQPEWCCGLQSKVQQGNLSLVTSFQMSSAAARPFSAVKFRRQHWQTSRSRQIVTERRKMKYDHFWTTAIWPAFTFSLLFFPKPISILLFPFAPNISTHRPPWLNAQTSVEA